MKRLLVPLALAGIFLALVFGVGQARSDVAPQANCLGGANSGGAQGAFASSQATSLPPGQFGAQTSAALGGGTIGSIARSNDCG
jgi:hypothetical protein